MRITPKTSEDWKSLRLTKAIYAHIREDEIFIVFETVVSGGTKLEYAETYPNHIPMHHTVVPGNLRFSSVLIGSRLGGPGLIKYLKDITRISVYHTDSSDNSKQLGLRTVTTEIDTKKGAFYSTEYFQNETWPYLSSPDVRVVYKSNTENGGI